MDPGLAAQPAIVAPDAEEEGEEPSPAAPPEPQPSMPAHLASLQEAAPAHAMTAEAPKPAGHENGQSDARPDQAASASEDDSADEGEPEAADVQQAAIISEPREPRRGWWNRFVRKSD